MTATDLTGWTIVFDLDGTLVDTAPDLHASLNHCLQAAGFAAVPFDAVRGMIGEGAKAMIRKGLEWNDAAQGSHDIEPMWEAFLDHYQQNICRLSRPFPNAVKVVDGLIRDGAICAVCTNKTQRLAETVLDELGLSGKFAAVMGADSVPARKPDGGHILRTITVAGGQPRRAIMIGDSQTDERAARNAGLPFVFVTFGYGPAPERAPVQIAASTYVDVRSAINAIAS